ncbi:excinuclease ABC subunit UvrC [Mollicutes bacterium LVI A0039]|nr:excinuclease ABC subunit UvrC [Mollicutes bacterium LVI A0039]
MKEQIVAQIKEQVLDKPGCYMYFNRSNQIIYVGKAKNLKKRMLSYFNRVNNIKTTKLVGEIAKFETFVTSNEREALILENNLIKQHEPKYNILLKDDKRYPSIVVTREQHPRILKVRDTKLKGKYYGPYPSNFFVNEIIEVINKEVPLRKCHKLPKEECIYYHIKQCYAPCIKTTSSEEIKAYKNEVDGLLNNNLSKMKKLLTTKMLSAAENLEFEQAGKFKSVIAMIEEYKQNQAIEFSRDINIDIYGIYADDSWLSVSILTVKEGRVQNVSSGLTSHDGDINESLISYLYTHYLKNEAPINFIIDDSNLDLVGEIESQLLMTYHNSHLTEYKSLLEMAMYNSRSYFKNNVNRITNKVLGQENDGFDMLKQVVKSDLHIIEVYDISHIGGDAQVAAKVVYQDGKKNPKLYRKYKIKEAKAADDYGSLREVLTRRLNLVVTGEEPAPDLLIIDGGKGQVSSGLEVLEALGLENKIKIFGLAKDDFHKTRAIVNKYGQEHELNRSSSLYKLLFDMQEEVHRFAIDFHRQTKTKSLFSSKLDSIPGLGVKRKRLLLDHFGDIESIKVASTTDIQKLSIPEKVAVAILEELNK